LNVVITQSEPKTIYLACKVIKTGCEVAQNAKNMKKVKGPEWVKAARKSMSELQNRKECIAVKKLYEMAIDIEDKWLRKEKKGAEKELEYDRDYERVNKFNF
jgi:hypothetical protein